MPSRECSAAGQIPVRTLTVVDKYPIALIDVFNVFLLRTGLYSESARRGGPAMKYRLPGGSTQRRQFLHNVANVPLSFFRLILCPERDQDRQTRKDA